jgi:hypothetical protein
MGRLDYIVLALAGDDFYDDWAMLAWTLLMVINRLVPSQQQSAAEGYGSCYSNQGAAATSSSVRMAECVQQCHALMVELVNRVSTDNSFYFSFL